MCCAQWADNHNNCERGKLQPCCRSALCSCVCVRRGGSRSFLCARERRKGKQGTRKEAERSRERKKASEKKSPFGWKNRAQSGDPDLALRAARARSLSAFGAVRTGLVFVSLGGRRRSWRAAAAEGPRGRCWFAGSSRAGSAFAASRAVRRCFLGINAFHTSWGFTFCVWPPPGATTRVKLHLR